MRRAGMDEEGELHQYVIYEQEKRKGPKVIKLDDPKGKNTDMEKYSPPTSLTVHLSKIDMPELKPRTAGQPPDKNNMKDKEKGKDKDKEKGKDKDKEKLGKKDKRKEDERKQKKTPSPPPGKLAKPPGSSSSKSPPSPGYQTPPPVPHHSRPPLNMWAPYPSQYNQQQSGALNTGAPPPPPPPLASVVSNLMGRLDRFTKR